jgi:predicted GIY-YIG superfamily endonuclease
MTAEKEFLYIGYYIDTEKNFILKIGTTNNLERRKQEHTRNYKRSQKYTMPATSEFKYLWSLPLSKYNTLRYEDRNREQLKQINGFEFVRNDRFCIKNKPDFVNITIRKTYQIAI